MTELTEDMVINRIGNDKGLVSNIHHAYLSNSLFEPRPLLRQAASSRSDQCPRPITLPFSKKVRVVSPI